METEQFRDKVLQRVEETEREARERMDIKLIRGREEAEREQQAATRKTREQVHGGYTPEEIWGGNSPEARSCRQFLEYMKSHDFVGSKSLVHEGAIITEPQERRRWLKKEIVQEPVEREDDWSIRGYGIGFTIQNSWQNYERRLLDSHTYPYGGNVHQDIFLCEDGQVRQFSKGKIGLLEPINLLYPDTPKTPAIGAMLYTGRHYYGGGDYNVADENLDALLVQVATHHTELAGKDA